MDKGYIGLTLHAHLPFVRNPEFNRFLEEDWLYEAISETYLPMLRVFNRLRADGIPYKLTFSISPTLSSMLSDHLLQSRYAEYADRMLNLGQKEMKRTADQPEFYRLAKMYCDMHQQNLEDFNELYKQNILTGFRSLEETGHLVLITSAATHAFLPLYQDYPQAVKAQVELAIESHISHFRKKPKGFWLPECGYYPGLEKILSSYDIKYFFTATHALTLANKKVERGIFAPVDCGHDISAFARDYGLSQAVWSEDDGYPVDRVYRDFYRDIGYDLDVEYLKPYLHDKRIRSFTGFKYWAVTSKSDFKRVYNPDIAQKRVSEHAGNFIYMIERKTKNLSRILDRPPLFTLPFDAELFGHWWFEGVSWLEEVIRLLAENKHIELLTSEDYLSRFPENQHALPAYSSWGTKGYSSVWVDGSNDWIYRHIHRSIDRMTELVERFPDQVSLKGRFLKHAAREILLAMASDWPFVISNGTSVGYAQHRLKEHIHNFNLVYENMCRNSVNTEWLTRTEKKTNIFPDIDYRIFSRD
jgi:1,4-alpha-glucan branching enzyme